MTTQEARESAPSVLSDDELLTVITRDLRAVYTDIIRQPLPTELAAALQRVETRAVQPWRIQQEHRAAS